MAERVHVSEGTIARSLLSSVLDDAEPDPVRITDVLDRIPGAFERVELSSRQAREGKTVALDEWLESS